MVSSEYIMSLFILLLCKVLVISKRFLINCFNPRLTKGLQLQSPYDFSSVALKRKKESDLGYLIICFTYFAVIMMKKGWRYHLTRG